MRGPGFPRLVRRGVRNPLLRRHAAVVCVLAVFALLSITAFAFYSDRIADNLAWSEAVRVERETRLVSRVFELSQANGLIGLTRDEKSGRLMVKSPPCERSLLKPPAERHDSGEQAALGLLCASPQGAEVRAEIEAWNTFFDFLAVRDNRSQNDRCRESDNAPELKVEIYVPRGCKPNQWHVDRISEEASVPAVLISEAEPPPTEYGFLVDPQEPLHYAGDWARVAPDPYAEEGVSARYRLTSGALELPTNGVVSIDLVGRLRQIKIGAAAIKIDPSNPQIDKWTRVGDAYVRVWLACHPDDVEDQDDGEDDEGDEDANPDCSGEPTAAQQARFAYQIDVSQFTGGIPGRHPARPRDVDVVIEAESATFLPKSLRDDEEKVLQERGAHLHLTRHLRATCAKGWLAAEHPALKCQLAWLRAEGVDAPARSMPRIVLGDGTKPNQDLIDPTTGFIVARAFEHGLGPIIGLGPHEWGSLVATLAARPAAPRASAQAVDSKGGGAKSPPAPPPEPFRLTINDRIQEAAYQTLVSYRACGSKKSDNRRSRPACGGLSRGQTATLVVLDADEQTPGAIRAIASLPEPPKKLHLWDLSALEDSDVTPTGLGWRAVGRDNVPGSTFKAITSMTAITAATAPDTNPDYTAFAATLRRLLSGGMSAQAQVDLLRLAYAPPAPARQRGSRRVAACTPERRRPEDSNTIPVPDTGRPSWCGRNFHGAQFWDPKAPGDTKCPAALGGGSQFGMCEALMVSSNLFFGGVAQHLINSPLLDNRGDPITLAVARRLTFGSGIRAPLPGYAKSTANGFDLTRGQAPAPRLSADPVDMTAALPENRRRNPGAVVRSGFGDDVQATPLAMATAYASIARQKFVRPTIVPTERDSQGCPKVRADPDECKDILEGARDAGPLMRVLRAGLHAVATSGSGRAAFNTPDGKMFLELNHQPRLFVKTGTATVVKGRRFSLWMAGWIEGAPGTNIPTRLAFACFLTHRTNAEVGGGTCGPIIRDLLVRLDRTGSG